MEIVFSVLVCLEIIMLAAAFALLAYSRKVKKEIKIIVDEALTGRAPMTPDHILGNLPPPVLRYAKYAIKDKKQMLAGAVVKQSGYIRTSKESPWLPLTAVQYLNGTRPGFIWVARAGRGPKGWLSVRDMYHKGKGSMIIKLFSLLKIIEATGPEMDVSSFIRFVSEAVFIPHFLVFSNLVTWQKLDNSSALVVVKDGASEAKIKFIINREGQITRAETKDRFRKLKNKYIKQKWVGNYSDYKQFGHLVIPTNISAEWQNAQSFCYVRLHIEDIKYLNKE